MQTRGYRELKLCQKDPVFVVMTDYIERHERR
jgi:hypothetical protein